MPVATARKNERTVPGPLKLGTTLAADPSSRRSPRAGVAAVDILSANSKRFLRLISLSVAAQAMPEQQ